MRRQDPSYQFDSIDREYEMLHEFVHGSHGVALDAGSGSTEDMVNTPGKNSSTGHDTGICRLDAVPHSMGISSGPDDVRTAQVPIS
jgi:hypothetical protein